jgi:hypothetical protein
VCWFRLYGVMEHDDPVPPCDGQLVRCHLIPKQELRRLPEFRACRNFNEREAFLYDRRAWAWGCGGPMGDGGHHGLFDHSRRLCFPREAVPAGTEELAYELGLLWFLDRTYGPKELTAA